MITIESRFLRQDTDYVYLECGKYLKRNIIKSIEVAEKTERAIDESLVDDA